MGYLFRPKFTKPVPAGAVIGGGKARWTDTNGKKHVADLTPNGRIRIECETWSARYTVDGRTITRSTGCEKRANAEAVLRGWEADAEKVLAGILKPEDIRAKQETRRPLDDHVSDFEAYMRGKRRSERHISDTANIVRMLARECGWQAIGDIRRKDLEQYAETKLAGGLGANTVHHRLTGAVSFCRWAVRDGRLTSNPLDGLEKPSIAEDRRHVRRALTEADFLRLIEAAKSRPLHDAMHKNRGDGVAKLSEPTRAKLIESGENRSSIYSILFYTGLRFSELRRLRVKSVALDGPRPCLLLEARSTKAKRGDIVPLPSKIVPVLARQIEGKAPEDFVIEVPENLIKIFDRDLEFAGIPKKDDQGRVLDIHALRMSLGTNLLRNGVPLVNVQKIMRHSTPTLTANLYTDVSLLDLHGAMDSTFPDNGEPEPAEKVTKRARSGG